MKKIFKLLLVILFIFIISSCGFGDDKISDSQKFKKEYEKLNGDNDSNGKKYLELSISEDNPILYSSIDKILEVLDGTGVIYLGYPECPWCRNAVPVLLKAAQNTGIDKIYYLNMKDVRDQKELDSDKNIITSKEAEEGYFKILDKLNNILEEYVLEDENGEKYDTLEKRIYVPTVLFVYNGSVVDYHFDTIDSQDDPYVALNEEQTLELYNIYLQGIHKVLNDQCGGNEGEEHC